MMMMMMMMLGIIIGPEDVGVLRQAILLLFMHCHVSVLLWYVCIHVDISCFVCVGGGA